MTDTGLFSLMFMTKYSSRSTSNTQNDSDNSQLRLQLSPERLSDSESKSLPSTKSETPGPNATKVCTICREEKLLTAFAKDKQKPDGLYPHCKICNNLNARNRKRLRQLHKEPEDSRCECCGEVKKLVLDHDHQTQAFRGWLCGDCNMALGKLGDDTQGVLNALDYLERKNMLNAEFYGGLKDDVGTV